jgi:phosphoglycolate phosphatase
VSKLQENAAKAGRLEFDWVRAVVFDLDGTLIDSAPDLAAALNLVLEMRGLEPLETAQVRFMIGAGVPKLIERGFRARGERGEEVLAESLDPELLDAFLSYYNAHADDLTKVYPGVYDLLLALANLEIPVGLCTNKPIEATREILASFQIEENFASVIGGTSGFPKKPDPAGLLACVRELGARPEETLYIGDSATDVKLARNAGLPVALVSYGYEKDSVADLDADLVVDRLEEIIAALPLPGKVGA